MTNKRLIDTVGDMYVLYTHVYPHHTIQHHTTPVPLQDSCRHGNQGEATGADLRACVTGVSITMAAGWQQWRHDGDADAEAHGLWHWTL